MQTLKEALDVLTADKLSSYLHLFLPDETGGNKKANLIQRIEKGLAGDKLQSQYQLLDQWQQLAVAETLYAADQRFHSNEFKAKYGQAPALSHPVKSRYGISTYNEPARLCLFLYSPDRYAHYAEMIPEDLRTRLKAFVPEPMPVSLVTRMDLPEHTEEESELTIRPMEQEALMDLSLLLGLIEQGKVQVSEKTGRGSAATLRKLAETLINGDYYVSKPRQHSWEQEIGPIKTFAWPLLLQAAKLVQINGKKLALSKTGVNQLSKPPADTLRLIWQRWQKTTLLDEFKRIDDIKGQNAKGRVMTAIAPRRAMIEAGLQQCPVGEWVEFDHFSNFMQASKLHFDVTHDPWKLYIGDANYGSLGYADCHDWSLLQGRYLLCLLFEYAATLGMVDVAYIDPDHARDDFRSNWGADEMYYLSRYDGLKYFRLTPLGAYCLGLSDTYQPLESVSHGCFRVLPGLQVNLVSGQLSPEDRLLLETWTVQESEQSWRLEKAKTISAIEKGHSIENLRAFLQSHDDQPLPETVEGFMLQCQKQGQALKPVGTALLIECASEAVAIALAEHQETAKLCQRVGKKQLLVKSRQEDKFRQAVRVVGFGMLQ